MRQSDGCLTLQQVVQPAGNNHRALTVNVLSCRLSVRGNTYRAHGNMTRNVCRRDGHNLQTASTAPQRHFTLQNFNKKLQTKRPPNCTISTAINITVNSRIPHYMQMSCLRHQADRLLADPQLRHAFLQTVTTAGSSDGRPHLVFCVTTRTEDILVNGTRKWGKRIR